MMEESVKPTLQLIAERAGVSKMTVSRVLRNYPNHDPHTREKVLRIAAELNYRKNPLIAALMTNLRHKNPTQFRPAIALIYCNPLGQPLHPNRANLRKGIEDEAKLQGFEVDGFHIHQPGTPPDRLLQVLEARGYRCLIFEHFLRANVSLNLDLGDFAGVSITNSLIQPRLNHVDPDHHSGFLLAVAKLKEYGYEHFGFIAESLGETINQNRRLAAFLLSQLEVPRRKQIPLLWRENNEGAMKTQLRRWVTKYRPEAILSSVAEIPAYLQDLGYSIPDDMGFVHLGLSENSGKVAGINQNWYEIGVIAASQAIDQLVSNKFGPPAQHKITFAQPYWVEGETLPQKLAPAYEMA